MALPPSPTPPAAQAGAAPVGLAGYHLVGVIILLILLSYIDRAVLSLYARPIQDTLDLSNTQMGLLFGLGFIAPLALITLAVGWAIDRYNRVLIILAGLTVWSVATAFCGLANSFAALLVARACLGAGEAGVGPAGYALIADCFPPERRGRAGGAVTAAVSVGVGAAMLVGGALLQVLGPDRRVLPVLGELANWQVAFVFLGSLGIPCALLVTTLRDPRPSGKVDRPPGERASATSFVRGRWLLYIALFVCAAINVAAGTGIVGWAPKLMTERFAMPAGDAGYLLGMMSIVGGLTGRQRAARPGGEQGRRRGGAAGDHPRPGGDQHA